MNVKWLRRGLPLLAIAGIVAGFAWLLWPQPVLVDVAKVWRGHMETTVDEEGVSRIRDVYVVSAPVSGRVERNPREVGDRVIAGKTAVAAVRPADPTMLDVRTRIEFERAVEAAKAAVDLATAELRRAAAGLSFAQATLRRSTTLSRQRIVSMSALEKAQLDAEVATEQVETAKAALDARKHDLEMAQARLIGPNATGSLDTNKECCITLTSPVNGVVLKIAQKSEQIVAAGAPLVEIGNPLDTEIMVELLSTDAVKVKRGARARITGWGGAEELNARVSRIDPAAFTKISALGIEEQRVRAILDIADPPARWTGLGHEFRVFVHIVIWESDTALQVPLSALIRSGEGWAVFRIMGGIARLSPIEVGEMNARAAHVVSGLSEGELVVLHPSDRIEDGVATRAR
jgi:HlyD family secretion protein